MPKLFFCHLLKPSFVTLSMPSTAIKTLLVFCVGFISFNQVCAQKPIKRPENFHTWVYTGRTASESGYLTYASRDSIVLNSSIMFQPQVMGRYKVSDMSQIRFRRSNSQGIGALAGLVGGGLIGYFTGSAIEGDDYCGSTCVGAQPGTVTALVTIGSALVGTAIGLIIGSRKRKMKLNGKLTPEQLLRLQEYVIPMAPR
jgi:hypothetical protein